MRLPGQPFLTLRLAHHATLLAFDYIFGRARRTSSPARGCRSYFVGAEEGATSLIPGMYVHEFVHDGRHLLGFPCH
jgi:hypothetical protein